MGYLLDTHVILWAMNDKTRLSRKALHALGDTSQTKYVSLASFWEIAIKNRIGKLPLSISLDEMRQMLTSHKCKILNINHETITTFNTLPLLHRDPFDGILVATALENDLTVITNDENIQKYDVPWVW
ncbi:MAG: type II toxin-antitoxin system VapC family toxin [Defluviitaleaceae bacterium]|nr:type II toxin-antitoxin system VapC family toxin [Defluviitaleaceae bacterium]MCL2275913.1 type II toxin-antitoxin system VapC family toxin [Defluviitaleaceae bacterium]